MGNGAQHGQRRAGLALRLDSPADESGWGRAQESANERSPGWPAGSTRPRRPRHASLLSRTGTISPEKRPGAHFPNRTLGLEDQLGPNEGPKQKPPKRVGPWRASDMPVTPRDTFVSRWPGGHDAIGSDGVWRHSIPARADLFRRGERQLARRLTRAWTKPAPFMRRAIFAPDNFRKMAMPSLLDSVSRWPSSAAADSLLCGGRPRPAHAPCIARWRCLMAR
jgi:hypothetical protein